jgi:hypothetical protein
LRRICSRRARWVGPSTNAPESPLGLLTRRPTRPTKNGQACRRRLKTGSGVLDKAESDRSPDASTAVFPVTLGGDPRKQQAPALSLFATTCASATFLILDRVLDVMWNEDGLHCRNTRRGRQQRSLVRVSRFLRVALARSLAGVGTRDGFLSAGQFRPVAVAFDGGPDTAVGSLVGLVGESHHVRANQRGAAGAGRGQVVGGTGQGRECQARRSAGSAMTCTFAPWRLCLPE